MKRKTRILTHEGRIALYTITAIFTWFVLAPITQHLLFIFYNFLTGKDVPL